LWNVHNFCETYTTAGKHAQHLWNVHNISQTCTYRILVNTGWGRWNTICPIFNIIVIFAINPNQYPKISLVELQSQFHHTSQLKSPRLCRAWIALTGHDRS
jgi:hypothetical protein